MAQTTRQQIQTMFDLIETLKERKYLPGESKISDDRITDALRTMVEPNGLMDATIAKVLRPDMSGEEFEAVAMLDEEASYGLFDTYRAIMMPSDYDVSHAIACAFSRTYRAGFSVSRCRSIRRPTAPARTASRLPSAIWKGILRPDASISPTSCTGSNPRTRC